MLIMNIHGTTKQPGGDAHLGQFSVQLGLFTCGHSHTDNYEYLLSKML